MFDVLILGAGAAGLAAAQLVQAGRKGKVLEARERVCDWQTDPYAQGAYSYVAVGSSSARAQLAAPPVRFWRAS